jgi:hypothetical protein
MTQGRCGSAAAWPRKAVRIESGASIGGFSGSCCVLILIIPPVARRIALL